ncbi:sulfite exporter TauE/SafE family protein [Acidovorax sp.]|uniref:sulfite exporter TauE/SafE family protein n=1 Tax=Acidovorax sp. TaxID=1872122 RepID=UPI0025BC0253|nr:sulfite exporter TauE/SafE family protein [Acidovorax sp.]MBL7089398.1 sulfite exporter TauE/SafE family protein [Acidovorax sp.]
MEALTQGHSVAWLAALATSLVLTGLVAGVLAGLLGVGGGIVIVPVLYHVFTLLGVDESVRMHVAVGTSLATIVPTSIMSARAHRKRGSLNPVILRRLIPGVIVGVLIGAVLSGQFSSQVLTAVFATVAVLVALNMAFKRDDFAVGDGLPGAAGTSALGVSIGGLSTLMGIGGGTLSVPLLNALRVPMHVAVGTGAALGMVISLPGAAAFLYNGLDVPLRPPGSLGYINLLGVALIVPATMISTGWGAKLAHVINARRLRQLFALFLALTSARMFYGLLS